MKLDWAQNATLKQIDELYRYGKITRETYEKAMSEKYKVLLNK